jgi:hypothetical protein
MSQNRILYSPRQHKRKQKKLSREKIRMILVLGGLVVLFALCITVMRFPYFQIREIAVNGNGMEQDAQELRTTINSLLSGQYGLVIPKRFIFGISGRNLEKHLLTSLPRFETISVTKQYPHSLSISYAKRAFFGLLCNDAAKTDNHSCAYIDATGFVYESAPDAFGSLIVKIRSDLPVVKVGAQAIDEPTIKQMMLFGEGIKRIAGLRLLSYELNIQAPDELRLNVAPPPPAGGGGQFTLIVKKADNPEAVLQILGTVLTDEIKDRASQLDYVDLRFGNKVFYKFKKN